MLTEKYILHDSFSCIFLRTCQKNPVLFFDIETTGLYWKQSHLYLIGAIRYLDGKWQMTQWFAQKPSEEQLLLQKFSEYIATADRLIHFNGSSFDMPYLEKKYLFYQLMNPFENCDSIDLYRSTRICQKLFSLSSFRQKDGEKLLGFSREDRFSGKELISLYQEYLQTADSRLLDVLLLHNREDLTGMTELTALLSYHELFQGHFHLLDSSCGGQTLKLSFRLSLPVPVEFTVRQENFCCYCREDLLEITLTGTETSLKYFFPNYKDYYYLPLENTAIHKSVAAYVDKDHREKAKASNCFQIQQGLFFPQPKKIVEPCFYREYKGKPAYFLWSDRKLPAPESLEKLAAALLEEYRNTEK